MYENKILHIMCGLPRSGKSTIAHQLGCPIVEKDSIRLVMTGSPFIEELEPMVSVINRIMVESLFRSGHKEVVVDECHVTQASRDRWRYKGWTLKIHYVDTSVTTCLQRAKDTYQLYLLPVIKGMNNVFEPPIEDF